MSGPRPSGDDTAAGILLGLVGVGLALSELGAVAAAVTSLLSGHGWRWTPLSDAGPALARLVAHPARPGAAFPPAVAGGVTSPVLFWAVTVLLLAALVAAAGYGTVLYGRHAPAGGRRDGARWGTGRDERRLAVPADPASRPGRLVAGRGQRCRRLIAGADCISAVVFGPNGSGKSTGLIAPNALEWAGPVVVTTTKPQDVDVLLAARAAVGSVYVVAPGGCPGVVTTGWSPVDYVTAGGAIDPEAADRMAEWLVEASGMNADPKSRPWNAQARKYLKGLLLAANLSGTGIDGFVQTSYAGERAAERVEHTLAAAGLEAARREYASTWAIHEEGKGSVLFTAFGLADAYSRPSIRAAAQQSGFTAADLFTDGQPGTLIVVAPESDSDRYAPYLTALVSSVVHEAETRAAAAGGPIDPRLLLALDEAGNVFRFPRLPHLLTTARGNGIQLLLAYHDLAQLEHLYGGREVARTVVSNAKLRILLPGVGDLDTLRYFSDLFGRAQVRRDSHTRGDGRRTTSTTDQYEELAPLHLLRQLPDGQAIVQYQNLPPMRVSLRFWFTDRKLRALAGTPTP